MATPAHSRQGTSLRLTRWNAWPGVTSDHLQRLHAEAGFGYAESLEAAPADMGAVAVTNIQHLWVLPEALPFAWTQDATPPRPPSAPAPDQKTMTIPATAITVPSKNDDATPVKTLM